MQDLLTRIFTQWRTSLEGLAMVIVAWLASNGFDLSETNKAKITAYIALLAGAVWKFFSKDPVPESESRGAK